MKEKATYEAFTSKDVLDDEQSQITHPYQTLKDPFSAPGRAQIPAESNTLIRSDKRASFTDIQTDTEQEHKERKQRNKVTVINLTNMCDQPIQTDPGTTQRCPPSDPTATCLLTHRFNNSATVTVKNC